MRRGIPKRLSGAAVGILVFLDLLFHCTIQPAGSLAAILAQAPTSDPKIVLPRATVAVVQSTKGSASEIGYDEIKSLVQEAIQKAGGFGELIHDGDVVVLKPNLVSPNDDSRNRTMLPPEVNGVTTDWRVARAVVELVRSHNPSGRVYIMEGSADGTTRGNMQRLNYTPEHIPGVDEFTCLEESGNWEEWDSPKLVKTFLPDGVGLYPDSMKPNRSPAFYLNRAYYEADILISLPVLKTHIYTGVTGSVKNVGIGATPTNIYGGAPGDNHRELNQRINHRPEYLHKWIHDYYLCKPVDFTIMDGLQGLSMGPTASGPLGSNGFEEEQQNMRLILAGRDALAVDAIAALVMGFDPSRVDHLALLSDDGIGCIDPASIRVAGRQVHEVKKAFRIAWWGLSAVYADYDPPALAVNSAYIDEGRLRLALSVDPETKKVEVAIDGKLLDPVVIHDFDDIALDIGATDARGHSVTVFAYDRYLNASSQQIVPQQITRTDIAGHVTRMPDTFELFQNRPNPFNPTTMILYQLAQPGHVTLSVYNAAGQEVDVLVDSVESAGLHTAIFDGAGKAAGRYSYELRSSGQSVTRSMILEK